MTVYLLRILAFEYFVRGSLIRHRYGAAPKIQFNDIRRDNEVLNVSTDVQNDAKLISENAGIKFFPYGPRWWMLGRTTPLEALQDPRRCNAVITRIIDAYPERVLPTNETLYRLRANPENPSVPAEYDSAPKRFLSTGRLDSQEMPIMYCSQDIEGCVHECRVTVEDELYLATFTPTRNIKLLDLSALLLEDNTDEFESLDIAVNMLFYAADHSYPITRKLAKAAKAKDFDGLIYPSYYSQVRNNRMPFDTVLGISVRRLPGAGSYVKSSVFANVALFGRPLHDGLLKVACINRLILRKAQYDIGFGPVPVNLEP